MKFSGCEFSFDIHPMVKLSGKTNDFRFIANILNPKIDNFFNLNSYNDIFQSTTTFHHDHRFFPNT